MTDQQSTTFLFDVELDLQEDLEKGHLSGDFRRKFRDRGISLSDNVAVTPKEESGLWRIRDKDECHTYIVEETNEKLNVYSPTDVILVVKGAGLHEAGDTLDLFIQGFWPAVIELTSERNSESATQLAYRQEHEILQDYKPPSHIKKERTHLAEISIRDPSKSSRKEAVSHRIWVKEAYWELGENPPSPWKALFNEWHMATYALRRELTNWLRSLVLRFLRVVPPKILTRIANLLKVSPPPRLTQFLRTKGEPARDLIQAVIARTEFLFIFLSFWVIYSFLGTMFLVSVKGNTATLLGLKDTDDFFKFLSILRPALFSSETRQTLVLSLFPVVVAVFMSWRASLQIYNRNTYQEGRLPGFQRWIAVLLIMTFLFNTWDYLIFLVLLLIPIVMVNISRNWWWDYRPKANTDRKYESYSQYKGRTEKRDFLILWGPMNVLPWMVYYRMVVVWVLPIAYLMLFVAKFLVATKILGDFGKTIDMALNDFIGGGLGDVSAYAMDPARALRIRSAVEYDIKFFHQMKGVDNIHIFAHSQGTPITFETIFTHMPKEYRKKIKTYVTIGSVLSYYYQIVPVLDQVYFPERFRKSDYELGTFADGFRWFNCWNLADNITEFYGLDEFDLDILKENKNASGEVKCPTNIKTRLRGHSDYWTNLDQVQIPFARRILDGEVDEKWEPKTKSSGKISYEWRIVLTTILLIIPTFPILAILALLFFWTRTWEPISFHIAGIPGMLIDAETGIEFFDTILAAIGGFLEGLSENRVIEILHNNLGWILPGIIVLYIMVQIGKSVWFLWKLGLFNRGWRVRHLGFLDVFMDDWKRSKKIKPWMVERKHVQQMVAYVGANWWTYASLEHVRDVYGFEVGSERLEAMRDNPQAAVEFLEKMDEVGVDQNVVEFYRKRLEYGKGGMNKDEVRRMEQYGGRDVRKVERRLDKAGKDFLGWVKSEWKPAYRSVVKSSRSRKEGQQDRRDETQEEPIDS